MRRRGPRPLDEALGRLASSVAPLTPLARIQSVWADAVGAVIAEHAEPLRERAGVLTVLCRQSVWAQEITLMGVELTARLNAALGEEVVRQIRTTSTPR